MVVAGFWFVLSCFILLWGKDILIPYSRVRWRGFWAPESSINLIPPAPGPQRVCRDTGWWQAVVWVGQLCLLATKEPRDLCVLWAKPYARRKLETVSCGPDPSLRPLGLHSLVVISVWEEGLLGQLLGKVVQPFSSKPEHQARATLSTSP